MSCRPRAAQGAAAGQPRGCPYGRGRPGHLGHAPARAGCPWHCAPCDTLPGIGIGGFTGEHDAMFCRAMLAVVWGYAVYGQARTAPGSCTGGDARAWSLCPGHPWPCSSPGRDAHVARPSHVCRGMAVPAVGACTVGPCQFRPRVTHFLLSAIGGFAKEDEGMGRRAMPRGTARALHLADGAPLAPLSCPGRMPRPQRAGRLHYVGPHFSTAVIGGFPRENEAMTCRVRPCR